jgi:hypothetical protein
VIAKIGKVIREIVGVDRAEERVVCRRICQPALCERLITRFDVLRSKLEGFFGDMTRRATAAIAMHIWKVPLKKASPLCGFPVGKVGFCATLLSAAANRVKVWKSGVDIHV